MFTLCGQKVALYQFKVNYKKDGFIPKTADEIVPHEYFDPFQAPEDESVEEGVILPPNMKQAIVEDTAYFLTEEEKDKFIASLPYEYEAETLDSSDYAWMKSYEFASCDIAQQALEMGEQAYRAILNAADQELQMAKQFIDLDFRLSILEDE